MDVINRLHDMKTTVPKQYYLYLDCLLHSVVAAPVLREGDQSKETGSFGYQTERPLQ